MCNAGELRSTNPIDMMGYQPCDYRLIDPNNGTLYQYCYWQYLEGSIAEEEEDVFVYETDFTTITLDIATFTITESATTASYLTVSDTELFENFVISTTRSLPQQSTGVTQAIASGSALEASVSSSLSQARNGRRSSTTTRRSSTRSARKTRSTRARTTRSTRTPTAASATATATTAESTAATTAAPVSDTIASVTPSSTTAGQASSASSRISLSRVLLFAVLLSVLNL